MTNYSNELKIYKVKCKCCDGHGEKHSRMSENVTVNIYCFECQGKGFKLVDWIEHLKTPKKYRLEGNN